MSRVWDCTKEIRWGFDEEGTEEADGYFVLHFNRRQYQFSEYVLDHSARPNLPWILRQI